uniref:Uncharacterized protein n=1 Tax=Sphaerodactylus townsendi TaxID=933632 RepID=A0ACB8G627_9SAUR
MNPRTSCNTVMSFLAMWPEMLSEMSWGAVLIKELTGNLNRNSSSSSLSSGPVAGLIQNTSHPSTPNVEKNMYGVAVQDFTSSWRSGLAFLAIIKAIDASLVDIQQALDKSSRDNLEDAFTIARDHLGIPRLLEPEDIMVESPDEQSVVTYIAQFLENFPELEGEDFSDPDKELPIESTYVHVKDTPVEEKPEKILILNENGGHTYTTHWDRSQSPPPKVHILDLPLDQEDSNLHMANQLHDNLSKPLSDHSETLTESLHSEALQRPTSLPVIEPAGFQSSPVPNSTASKISEPELNLRNSLKRKDKLPPEVFMNSEHPIDPSHSSEDSQEDIDVQGSFNQTQEPLGESLDSLPRTSHPLENTSDLTKEYPASDSPVEQTAQKYILEMLHEEISKLPETVDSADGEAETSDLTDNSDVSLPSPAEYLPPPIRNSPKSLDTTKQGSSLPQMTPNSSKVSVIPHELFYYPHYDVPISAVLDAFTTPVADSFLPESNKICPEVSENSLDEKEPLALANEEGGLKPGLSANVEVSPTPTEDIVLGKRKRNSHAKSSWNNAEANVGWSAVSKAKSTVSSSQKDSARPDVPVIMVNQFDTTAVPEERKTTEERSKRKEKRKNKGIFQGENTQGAKAGSTRLLDKLEEDSADHQGFSRACYSDSNVVFQRITDRVSKESVGTDDEKSAVISESFTSSTRKRKGLETKDSPDKASPHSSTSHSDQPELFYFIVFLWVLVYCLLLLPQLISNPL